ncbi:uncharacterized protein BDZ99DRAFT_62399 [Mytilinidion resinicola]|uniref:Uncharacterized protein n=1 Tax=Mytilinidion resinicola TaxID=574789 RepID=A0A6A6YGL4_9PEZI|nr:uncharacterized protein BDZ99DRAFT_62399 [Mytilinidion resinicola]KAF2807673.1 hypothetical protein BDZ99DRAFT_62399 [Mytilinidion resinicola]
MGCIFQLCCKNPRNCHCSCSCEVSHTRPTTPYLGRKLEGCDGKVLYSTSVGGVRDHVASPRADNVRNVSPIAVILLGVFSLNQPTLHTCSRTYPVPPTCPLNLPFLTNYKLPSTSSFPEPEKIADFDLVSTTESTGNYVGSVVLVYSSHKLPPPFQGIHRVVKGVCRGSNNDEVTPIWLGESGAGGKKGEDAAEWGRGIKAVDGQLVMESIASHWF